MEASNVVKNDNHIENRMEDDNPVVKIIEFPLRVKVEFKYTKFIPDLDAIAAKYDGERSSNSVIGYNNSAMRYCLEYSFPNREKWNEFYKEAKEMVATATILNK